MNENIFIFTLLSAVLWNIALYRYTTSQTSACHAAGLASLCALFLYTEHVSILYYMFIWSAGYYAADCFYQEWAWNRAGVFIPHHVMAIIYELFIMRVSFANEPNTSDHFALLWAIMLAEISNFPMYYVMFHYETQQSISPNWILLEFWCFLLIRSGVYVYFTIIQPIHRSWIFWTCTLFYLLGLFWTWGIYKSYLKAIKKEKKTRFYNI